jgi:hypothetical protein
MKLIFLSADNLRNGPFIKDLVYNFKGVGKCILLHDHFGSVSDTRFVTKRISALMSEEMIVNNAFSGDQRNILSVQAGEVAIRIDFLENALKTVDLVLLNALGMQDGAIKALDPLQVLAQLRVLLGLEEVYLFPKNTRSPLVAQRRRLVSPVEIAELKAVYDEEALALDRAEQMLPAILAAPGNFKVSAT